MKNFVIPILAGAMLITACTQEQPDTIYYTGNTLSNPDYHHGQLPLAMGVHNIQVMRASREDPGNADGFGWTYNHAPNLAYWNDTFFLQYLSNRVGEHIPPGQTLLCISSDGIHWGKPRVAFPPYPIPDGTSKEGVEEKAIGITAVMHQRMGFYTSTTKRFLMLGYHGISLHRRDSPNDGLGIGRVVREIYRDGSLGPIYFIRYNQAHKTIAGHHPFYRESSDSGFVEACDELLDNPLQMQQWNEESDRDDPLIPQPGEYKALSWYTLGDGRVVGLWKHALCEISNNGGQSWDHIQRAPGFVTKNAKIWGQRTTDGNFVTVCNPSEFRWPLALSVSRDGLEYTNLLLVNGEITTMRYGGNYKSYGPQYVRGIQEGNGNPPDGGIWLCYSMNKEDIWVSRVPVPVEDRETEDLDEDFSHTPPGSLPEAWNIFSPVLARVAVENRGGTPFLCLRDSDPFDMAKAERLFPECRVGEVEFSVMAGQKDHGRLEVELQDGRGNGALRLVLDAELGISVKDGYRMSRIMDYDPWKMYRFRIEFDAGDRLFHVYIDGKLKKSRLFYRPVQSLERICFRTGTIRRFPDVDTPTDQDFDVADPGKTDPEASFFIQSLKSRSIR